MRFEWDERKNKMNKIKHGISFQEAKNVFDDQNAVVIYDEPHSVNEDRFFIIGMDIQYREMVVCHCYRAADIIRIISARKATKNELALCWRNGYEK